MTSDFSLNKTKPETSFGYHDGAVETVISVDDVNRQAQELAETISKEKIASLIYPVGFFNTKAKHLSLLPEKLKQFGGIVPDTIDELITLEL